MGESCVLRLTWVSRACCSLRGCAVNGLRGAGIVGECAAGMGSGGLARLVGGRGVARAGGRVSADGAHMGQGKRVRCATVASSRAVPSCAPQLYRRLLRKPQPKKLGSGERTLSLTNSLHSNRKIVERRTLRLLFPTVWAVLKSFLRCAPSNAAHRPPQPQRPPLQRLHLCLQRTACMQPTLCSARRAASTCGCCGSRARLRLASPCLARRSPLAKFKLQEPTFKEVVVVYRAAPKVRAPSGRRASV